MCHQNASASSPLALKFVSLKALTSNNFQVFNSHVNACADVADAAAEDICSDIKTGLFKTTELRDTTQGILKPGGGVNMWKRPLLPKVSFQGLEDW